MMHDSRSGTSRVLVAKFVQRKFHALPRPLLPPTNPLQSDPFPGPAVTPPSESEPLVPTAPGSPQPNPRHWNRGTRRQAGGPQQSPASGGPDVGQGRSLALASCAGLERSTKKKRIYCPGQCGRKIGTIIIVNMLHKLCRPSASWRLCRAISWSWP
jgi:hypothetical protein